MRGSGFRFGFWGSGRLRVCSLRSQGARFKLGFGLRARGAKLEVRFGIQFRAYA